MTVDARHASVFDAGLPTLAYDDTDTPDQLYPRIQSVQRVAPIALGPHGPEVLSHELVRAVLRDTRFQIPPGVHYCLGANLARLELAEALRILARRMANPRIVGPAPWKPMVSLSGPRTLPIEFRAAR